jgi:hypothetical protein
MGIIEFSVVIPVAVISFVEVPRVCSTH